MESYVINVISTILGVITLLLAAVTGYLGYLTLTFKADVEKNVTEQIDEKSRVLNSRLNVKMQLLDITIDLIMKYLNPNESSSINPDYFYGLQHIGRLTSNNDEEIKTALLAIEGLSGDITPLLPYVERIKQAEEWPSDAETIYQRILDAKVKKIIG